MYTKWGALEPAKGVFYGMMERNSMVMGYGNHGRAEEALKLFSMMEKRGPMPTILLLSAFSICLCPCCSEAMRSIKLAPTDIEPYMLLSNIYAEERNWDGVESIRMMMMKEKDLQKDAGASVIHTEFANSECS
ncbi:hypothetical protein CDL15_Pgr011875 [Punica granatum]|uniref:Pentatricopeptide repeat-containing protein n=1 Tax=Punica granatum TaxID=22663 RepID=A0A218XE26_PUNGR|nr:hypothetical protein CDL15_Pgr011875 [Punica granatum]